MDNRRISFAALSYRLVHFGAVYSYKVLKYVALIIGHQCMDMGLRLVMCSCIVAINIVTLRAGSHTDVFELKYFSHPEISLR